MYRYTELHFRQRMSFLSSINRPYPLWGPPMEGQNGNVPPEPNSSRLDVMLRAVMSASTYQTPTEGAQE